MSTTSSNTARLKILASFVALFLICVATCAAQDPPKPAEAKSQPNIESRQILVPFEDLNVVLNRDKRGVLMPVQEYLDLRKRAKQNEADSLKPPAAIVVSDAKYVARTAGEQLLVTAQIRFTQFKPGWHVIPLPLTQLAIEKATVNDQPARLMRVRNAKLEFLQLLVNQSGTATLELELSTPLSAVGGDKVASFGLLPCPAATLEVAVPAGKRLLVHGLSVSRPAEIDQLATYQVAIGGRRDINLRMTERDTERSTDSLLFATTGYRLQVAPGEVSWLAVTQLQIYGVAMDRMVFTVPKTLEIADVQSTGLESWELADAENDANRTQITLNYRQPFNGGREVTFRGVTTTNDDEPWSVPELILNDVNSHIGRVAVQFPAGVRLRKVEATGVRRAVQPAGSKAVGTATYFEAWREDFSLSFLTQTKQREVQTGISTIVDISDRGLELQTLATVESSFASLFELDLTLPAEWTVTSIVVAGKKVDWQTLPQQAGLHAVRVALNPPIPKDKETQVVLQAQQHIEGWPVEDEPVEIALPEVRLPQSAVVEGSYMIKADADLDVVPVTLSGLDPVRLNLPGERLGFTYQDSRFSGTLKLSRKPSQIVASTLSISRLDKTTFHSHLESQLVVSGGGIRTLKVALSESAGEDVRFLLYGSQARITEQTADEPADGERIWTLQFDRRIKGDFAVAVDVRSARGEDESFSPHRLRILDAERENGYVAVEAAADQRMKVSAKDAEDHDLADVDPVDLPQPRYSPKERIVAAYRYLIPGYSVTMSEERFDRMAVPTAVCHSANLKSVIGANGELQHRATFRLVAVGVQSLRVELTEGVELWATAIDGVPVEVRSLDGAYLVPLTQASQPDAKRKLQLFYRSKIEPLGSFGQLSQQPPSLTVVNGIGEEQPLAMLDQNWTVHYPSNTLLTNSDGEFTPDKQLDRTSLLGGIQQGFAAPSPSQLVRGGIGVAIVLAIVGILTLGFRKLGVAGLVITVVGMGLFGVMFAVVKQSAEQTASSFVASDEDTGSKIGLAPSSGSVKSEADFGVDMAEGGDSGAMDSDDIPADGGIDLGGVVAPNVDAPAETPSRVNGLTATAVGGAGAEAVDQKEMETSEILEKQEGRKRKTSRKKPAATRTPATASPNQPALVTNVPQSEAMPPGGAGGGGIAQPNAPQNRATRRNARAIDGIIVSGGAPPSQLDDVAGGSGEEAEGIGSNMAERDALPAKISGGRLSLSLKLQIPKNTSKKTFSYIGTEVAESGIGLDFMYESRVGGTALRLAIMTAVTLLFWWLRRSSLGLRGFLAAAGISFPLALVTVAPVSWHAVLDGVFLGAITGTILWFVCLAAHAVGRQISQEGEVINSIASQTVKASFLFACAFSLVTGDIAFAQKRKPAKKAAAKKPSTRPTEPTIVVPYDEKQNPLTAEKVFLSHDQFIALWNKANPDKQLKAPAPVDGLVAEALYAAELSKGKNADNQASVSVSARIVLYSFRNHQIKLPVPLGSVALNSAQLNGMAAPIVTRTAKGGGIQLDVVIGRAGVHVLDLQFQVKAQVTGPAGQFQLPIQSVPAGRLFFTLPAKQLNVRVNGSSNTFRLQSNEQNDVVEIPINGGNVSVAWQPQQAQGAVDGIVHVDSGTAVIVDDSGVRVSTGFRFSVPQGSISDAVFNLPENIRVQEIAGPDVAGWELNDNAGQRSIRVFFRRKVDDTTDLRFELFVENSRIADDAVSITVPDFRATQVTRETGMVAILAGQQFGLRPSALNRITQIDVGQFRSQVALKVPKQAARLAYRFTARPFQLPITIERRKPQTVGTVEYGIDIGRRKVTYATRLKLTLEQAPRSSLSFRVNENFIPIEVDATNIADWFVGPVEGSDDRILTIEFAAPQLGRIEVALRGTMVKLPDDKSVTMAVPVPLEISRLTNHMAIWLDNTYTANLTSFDGWRSVDPATLAADVQKLQPRKAQFAFSSGQAVPDPVVIALTRATPQMSAACVSVVSVTDTFVDYSLALQWNISRAAADTFRFVTPNWLAGRLNFKDPNIRQVTQSESEGDRTAWTVHLQEPVRDRYFVLAQATLPPVKADVQPPTVEFIKQTYENVAPLETQQQFVLLINLSQAQLSAENPDAVQSVQRTELPIKVSDSLIDQATEIVKLRRGVAAPVWKANRFEQQQGAAASVNVADLVMVIAKDATWRMQATYTIRNRSRQFLALQLPDKSALLSVFVNNRPSRPVQTERKKQKLHLIALPKTSEADLSFPVRVVLSGRLPIDDKQLPSGLQLLAKEIELPSPHVVSQTDDAEFGIPVAKTVWTVHLPDDLDASPVDDATRNNLTRVDYDESGMLYEMNSLSNDAAKLFEVWQYSPSKSRRMQAANNLKQLQLSLHNYHDVHGHYGNQDMNANAALDDARRSFREKFTQSQRWFVQQKALDAGNNYYFLDEQSQREQVDFNNNDIITRNGLGMAGESDSKAGEEQFNFQIGKQLTVTKSKEDKSKIRMEAKPRFDGKKRSVQRQQSFSNLQSLNRINKQLKDARKSAQQATQQQAQALDRLQAANESAQQAEMQSDESGRQSTVFSPFANDMQVAQSDESGKDVAYSANAGRIDRAWTQVGGLSLAIDIPKSGQKLTFSKVSGAPKLTLSIRPRRSLEIGFGAIWSTVWIVIGLGLAVTIGKAGSATAIMRHIPKALIALGLLAFFLLPNPIKWFGFTAFVLGACALGFQHRKPAQ